MGISHVCMKSATIKCHDYYYLKKAKNSYVRLYIERVTFLSLKKKKLSWYYALDTTRKGEYVFNTIIRRICRKSIIVFTIKERRYDFEKSVKDLSHTTDVPRRD